MKIVVINGSPTGNRGTTAQSVKYLQQQLGEHEFEVIEAARRIRRLERDRKAFDGIVEQLAGANAVLWAFPVYIMLVPAQLKRFIELLGERGGEAALAGKVCSAISTSAHHYDHTAHDYLEAVSWDLGMTYVHGFSAESGDLLTEDGRRNLLGFGRDFLRRVAGEPVVEAAPAPLQWTAPEFRPVLDEAPAPVPAERGEGRIVVVSDADSGDHNLARMIDVFERSVSEPVDRIELRELRMDGGCLGCMKCCDGDDCVYKDDYQAAFDGRVKDARVVIYAGAVRDRFLSARFKTFIDRFFYNGHRPVTAGQAVGYLISGPLGQLPVLREFAEAHVEVGESHRIGIVTDEQVDSSTTTRQLVAMARTVDCWLEDPWYTPHTYRGVGARLNFRDLVYRNRCVLSADHRYYKAHGFYDYPQKDWRKRLFNAVALLVKRIPMLSKRIERLLLKGRMRAYQQLVEG